MAVADPGTVDLEETPPGGRGKAQSHPDVADPGDVERARRPRRGKRKRIERDRSGETAWRAAARRPVPRDL